MQCLEGDGLAFVQAGGTIVRKKLKNETLPVDTGCLVAFTTSVDYDIEREGGLKSMIFGRRRPLSGNLAGHGYRVAAKFALFTNGRPYPIGCSPNGWR